MGSSSLLSSTLARRSPVAATDDDLIHVNRPCCFVLFADDDDVVDDVTAQCARRECRNSRSQLPQQRNVCQTSILYTYRAQCKACFPAKRSARNAGDCAACVACVWLETASKEVMKFVYLKNLLNAIIDIRLRPAAVLPSGESL